ncbi:hypothetical protein IQ250_26140 [Pseudanabaenaceae cyanobacterium LEGE 13415]|nr:hypothetical protein [Pseudanabaenaceae cyanobacterium LEGE 13415]
MSHTIFPDDHFNDQNDPSGIERFIQSQLKARKAEREAAIELQREREYLNFCLGMTDDPNEPAPETDR